MCLDAPCSFLDAAGPYLLAITGKGRMHVWNTQKCTAVIPPTSLMDLLNAHPATTIRSAKIRPNGTPIVSLSDGHIFAYHASLQSWTVVSTPWYSKGSEHWESRTRGRQGSVAGVLRAFEGITNDILVDQSVSGTARDDDADVEMALVGEESEPIGHAGDWSSAMTLAHLESRMAASEALDSPQEYKAALMLYASRLGADGFRNKAEELVRALMGPIYLSVRSFSIS
jgi:protein HIRA/HIR1